MAIKRFTATTRGGVVSQLRDNTKYVFLKDEQGNIYIPLVQLEEDGDGEADGDGDAYAGKKESPKGGKPKAGKAGKSTAKESAKEAVPAKGSKGGKSVDEVVKILTDLDAAELTEDKAVKKLVDLLKADRKKVQKIVTAMLDDEDSEIAAVAKKLKALAAAAESEDADDEDEEDEDEDTDDEDSDDEDEEDEDDEEEEDEKPGKGKAAKKKGIDPKSLKKGDKVTVYWGTNPKTEEEYDDDFDGKVVKIADGKISIHYTDDDETLVFDPKWQEIRSKG